MQPQQILIHPVQAGEHPLEILHHSGEGFEIGKIPRLVIFGKKCAVPKAVVKNRLVRVGGPESEVGQPEPLDRPHGVGAYGLRVNLQVLKNLRRLPVHIEEAFQKQPVLAIKVAVQGAGGNPRQLADVLNAHTLQAILTHGLHHSGKDSHFGVIQNNHFLLKSPLAPFPGWFQIIHETHPFDNTFWRILGENIPPALENSAKTGPEPAELRQFRTGCM